jgi:hypothetical protein
MTALYDKDMETLRRSLYTKQSIDATVQIMHDLLFMLDVVECAKELNRIKKLDDAGDPDKTATDEHRERAWSNLAQALQDLEDAS